MGGWVRHLLSVFRFAFSVGLSNTSAVFVNLQERHIYAFVSDVDALTSCENQG